MRSHLNPHQSCETGSVQEFPDELTELQSRWGADGECRDGTPVYFILEPVLLPRNHPLCSSLVAMLVPASLTSLPVLLWALHVLCALRHRFLPWVPEFLCFCLWPCSEARYFLTNFAASEAFLPLVKAAKCSPSGSYNPRNAGTLGSIPGLGRSPGEGTGNPLQYSCLENSMDRGVYSP